MHRGFENPHATIFLSEETKNQGTGGILNPRRFLTVTKRAPWGKEVEFQRLVYLKCGPHKRPSITPFLSFNLRSWRQKFSLEPQDRRIWNPFLCFSSSFFRFVTDQKGAFFLSYWFVSFEFDQQKPNHPSNSSFIFLPISGESPFLCKEFHCTLKTLHGCNGFQSFLSVVFLEIDFPILIPLKKVRNLFQSCNFSLHFGWNAPLPKRKRWREGILHWFLAFFGRKEASFIDF